MARCLALAVAVLAAAPALGQVSFRDDFEGSALLVADGGQWSNLVIDDPADSLGLAAGAGHSGDGGLRIINVVSTGQPLTGIGVQRDVTGTGAQYTRVWFRVVSRTVAAGFDNLLIISRSSAFYTGCQLHWSSVREAWRVNAFDQANTATIHDFDAGSAPIGPWQLAELAAYGMGTANGHCRAWVDGHLLADVGGLDWSQVQFYDVSLGPVNSNAGNAAVYELDAFEASPFEQASHLVVTVSPRVLVAGVCTPVMVAPQTSDGAGVSAPRNLPVELTASFPGAVWADPGCRVPASNLVIAQGTANVEAWVTASGAADAGTLRATSPDLLDGLVSVSVAPGDGPGGGGEPQAQLRVRQVGCGCTTSSPALLLIMAVVTLERRCSRRRSRSAS